MGVTLVVVCIECRCLGVYSRGLQWLLLWEMAGAVPYCTQPVPGSSSKPTAGYSWAPQLLPKVVAPPDKHIAERGKHCKAVRGVEKHLGKSPVDTKVRLEGGGGSDPKTGADRHSSAASGGDQSRAVIPLQTMEYPCRSSWTFSEGLMSVGRIHICQKKIWRGRSSWTQNAVEPSPHSPSCQHCL